MKESLGRHLGLPVLEDASPGQMKSFLALYEMICRRAQKTDDAPGPGLGTLYRTVVNRLQQVWLGTERASKDKIARVAHEAAPAPWGGPLPAILAGVAPSAACRLGRCPG